MEAESTSYLPDWDDDEPTLFPAVARFGALDFGAPDSAAVFAARNDGTPDESGVQPSVRAPASTSSVASIRPPAASIVRLRVPVSDPETRALLKDLGERQVALASGLAWAYARISALPRDPSTRAAGVTLSARIADLGDVRDALNELYCSLARHASLIGLVAGSPLALYLDGIYRWVLGSLDAMAVLADELLRLEADWATFRARLSEAQSFYPEPLGPAVRALLWSLGDEDARTDVTGALDELTFALRMLERNLEQRFG